jgi:ABC-2 type transport system permease protein
MVIAELRKLLGLPTAWAGVVLGALLAPLIVLINARHTHAALVDGSYGDVSDLGVQDLGIGLIGPMVLGVVVISSEYTSTGEHSPGVTQLHATLTAMPDRLRLLAAKLGALALVVFVQAVVVATAVLTLNEVLHGEFTPPLEAGRIAAALLYWVLLAVFSFVIALIARNGIVPLTILIINSTFVSVSYLLTKVTDLAYYLPDIAGARMFIRGGAFEEPMSPLTAGVTMTVWIMLLLAIGGYLFQRRDA